MSETVTVKHPNKQENPAFEGITYDVPKDTLSDWVDQGWVEVKATDTAKDAKSKS